MDKENLANSIVKAIAYAENGGAPDINNPVAGKTGEMKSIFQFTPATWAKDSKEFLGKEVPLSADAETYVMQKKVLKEINDGYTASQIASMHNAGTGEPDAYTGKFSTGKSSIGVNQKYGVGYDVPAYAKKVLGYAKEFYKQKTNNMNPSSQSNTTQQSSDPLSSVVSMIKSATTSTPKTNISVNPVVANQPPGLLKNVLSGKQATNKTT